MADDSVTTGSTGAAPSSGAPATPATATPSAASSTPASATATPAASEGTTAAPGSGEPPKERWADILESTRGKTRTEVEAEYRQKYGWADQFQQDPWTFVDSWVDQLAGHPQYQAQMIAKAARLVGSRRGQQVPQAVEEPAPDVPIVDAQGNVTGQTYSATQMKKWREWDWTQKKAALDEQLAPLQAMQKRQEQAEMMATIRAQSDQHATATLTELRKNSHFTEHEPQIKQALTEHPEWGDDVRRAFLHVLERDVFPTLSQNAERKVLADLKTQANGSSVRPDGSGTALPDFKKMKPDEVMKFMHDHPDIAEQFAHR